MKILLIISGAVFLFFLNEGVLASLIIPDPCYYHSKETSWLFDIFYATPSWNGDHPTPTIFNIILTLITGGFFGYFIYRRTGLNSAQQFRTHK